MSKFAIVLESTTRRCPLCPWSWSLGLGRNATIPVPSRSAAVFARLSKSKRKLGPEIVNIWFLKLNDYV